MWGAVTLYTTFNISCQNGLLRSLRFYNSYFKHIFLSLLSLLIPVYFRLLLVASSSPYEGNDLLASKKIYRSKPTISYGILERVIFRSARKLPSSADRTRERNQIPRGGENCIRTLVPSPLQAGKIFRVDPKKRPEGRGMG